MNTPGQLSWRFGDLEQGRDGERRDLIISWEISQPFVVFHMEGSRYIGQSDPGAEQ